MLRGSEVSKDSYHSPVKKIKTIKNLQTESDRQWTIHHCVTEDRNKPQTKSRYGIVEFNVPLDTL